MAQAPFETRTETDGRHDFDFLFGTWQIANRKRLKLVDPESEWIECGAEAQPGATTGPPRLRLPLRTLADRKPQTPEARRSEERMARVRRRVASGADSRRSRERRHVLGARLPRPAVVRKG